MAKISAHNSFKLAESWFDITSYGGDHEVDRNVGGVVRRFYVLRSDGKVLAASSFPKHPGGSYDRKRTGYSVAGTLKNYEPTNRQEMIAHFRVWVDRTACRHGSEADHKIGVIAPRA